MSLNISQPKILIMLVIAIGIGLVIHLTQREKMSSEWINIGEAESFDDYYSLGSTSVSPNKSLSIISLRTLKQPERFEDGNTYKSLVTKETIDCAKKTIKTESITLYADSFGAGTRIHGPELLATPALSYQTGSAGYEKIILLCEKYGGLTSLSSLAPEERI